MPCRVVVLGLHITYWQKNQILLMQKEVFLLVPKKNKLSKYNAFIIEDMHGLQNLKRQVKNVYRIKRY